MKKIVKLTENELTKIITNAVKTHLDSESLINEEYDKLAITESLIGETMSTLPLQENGWQNSLISYLYHKINKEFKNNNIQGKLFLSDFKSGNYSGDGPKIPFIKNYLIDINYRFIGSIKTDGNCRAGKMPNGQLVASFTLDLVASKDTLLSQLYTFVYHELIHAWQNAQINGSLNDFTPYNISTDNIEKNQEEYIKCINYILYFTNTLEKGAFNSEAIGELKFKYSHDKNFAKLPTHEQMESLFVTKEFSRAREYLEYLQNVDGKNELLKVINSELSNQMNITWKNYNGFLNMLQHRLDIAYKKYIHKVSKWLLHTHIEECVTWYL